MMTQMLWLWALEILTEIKTNTEAGEIVAAGMGGSRVLITGMFHLYV